MSCFKEKKVSYRGIPFDIVDEQNKTQNSVIVVAGEVRNMAPREITLTVPKQPGKVAGISILHASGWVEVNKIGEIFIRYADTGTQTIEVMGGRDVGNWWVGGDLSNGKIAWSSSNGIRTVGLYCSSFELGGAEPVSITFRVTNSEAIRVLSLPNWAPIKPVSIMSKFLRGVASATSSFSAIPIILVQKGRGSTWVLVTAISICAMAIALMHSSAMTLRLASPVTN